MADNLLDKASILLTPTAYNDGSMLSVKPENGDGDFTFSRGSAATRVNAQGLVENVQIISDELVSNGDFSQEGSELVTNGDFATDSDWTLDTGWSIGDGYAESTALSTRSIYQNIGNAVVGKIYKVTYTILETNGGNFRAVYGGVNGTMRNTEGTYVEYFNATSSADDNLYLDSLNVFIGKIDNISVKEVGQNWTFGTGYNMGDGKVVITNSSSSNLEQLGITITNTKKYKIDFTISDYTSGSIRPMLGSVGAVAGTYVSENGVYTETLTANNNFDRIVFRTGGTAFNGSIDNISVKEITDDTDIPRIDYTDGCGSWLLEPQSTNTVTYSEDFSQWSNISATLTSGYLAPDGTLGATKISGTIGTSNILLGSASSETATRTIWARTVSGTGTAKLMSYYQNTNNLFTLTEEWQRFELNGAIATGGLGFYVDFRDNSQTLNEFIIWGAQSEALSYATSYIPTNGATNTRLQDIATNSGNASLINSTEGVLYCEIAALANDGTDRFISISDNTNNNILRLQYRTTDNSINSQYKVGGVTQASLTASLNSLDFNKIAVKYKENDFSLWINGVKVATDNSGAVNSPGTFTEVEFTRGGSVLPFYGKVKALAVYKEALTDAQLQSLTTI